MSDAFPGAGLPAERPTPAEALPAPDGERAAVRDPNAPSRSGSRRRRGSRGGRGRSRGAGNDTGGAPSTDNGSAQGKPAPVPTKPKIGDTRPAPVSAATRPAPTGGDADNG